LKSKSRPGIAELCTDPKNPKSLKTDVDAEKANILAEFFSSVFTIEPQNSIPTLETRETENSWTQVNITQAQIKKVLDNLQPYKSPGIDNINPKLLKELSAEIAKPLEIIFNRSIQERKVPFDWKNARISATFKKGDKALAGNYRPVSLTSVVCKVLERLVRDHII
jgi:hypothetical protein